MTFAFRYFYARDGAVAANDDTTHILPAAYTARRRVFIATDFPVAITE